MPKTAAALDRDIQEALGLPPEVTKRWKAKMAAYKRAVAELEAGYSDGGMDKMRRARDAMDKFLWDATAHVPYVPGGKPHLAPPIQKMQAERDALVQETWQRAQERGRAANYRASQAEIKRLRDEERKVNEPYEWMRRR